MTAAARAYSPLQLRSDEVSRHAVRLVVVGPEPSLTELARLPELLAPGDLVVVNDAATLPASLRGTTAHDERFELRLSGPIDGTRLFGVVMDDGDFQTRTEDRGPPPNIRAGDRIALGALSATVIACAGRRVELVVNARPDVLWAHVYASGAPIQYAHRPNALPLYAVQTAYASRPFAAEMPSAGRPLTWNVLFGLRRAGIELATLTHAAGLSSTGDAALDRALPWPERYEIPQRTLDAIARVRRVIAIGTTVVRALESAHEPGAGTATLRLDGRYRPRVVDGIVSGLHVPGESHFELLSAFAPADQLERAMELAAAHGLSGHEFGDVCLVLAPRQQH
ncbi:MAG TPA: S-adenosylmethionine:tRNA ribosyltransferase-isomerase [Kofleriaceae bacterium]|nr:S-adenosylmethionine:tRNA ribosyltransferase-isomerase [Kofleriaceae bacterium]